MEFLVSILISPPEGTPPEEVKALVAEEGARAAELASQGVLRRLWRPADDQGLWRNVGLWSAGTESELRAAISSLPLFRWMTIEITGLTAHPNDPARTATTRAARS